MKSNAHPENNVSPRKRRSVVYTACALITALLLIAVWKPDSTEETHQRDVLGLVLILIGALATPALLLAFLFPRLFDRLFSRAMVRRYLFGAACFATLIAMFYAVENWRGKRAWQRCQEELKARGAVLDWTAYIPPVVPDEHNIYEAPMMKEWFVKDSLRGGGGLHTNWNIRTTERAAERYAVAHIGVAGDGTAVSAHESLTLNYDAGALAVSSSSQLEALKRHLTVWNEALQEEHPALEAAQGFTLVTLPILPEKPLQITLLGEGTPTKQELESFFAAHTPIAIEVRPFGTNRFQLWAAEFEKKIDARDYLAWTEELNKEFALLREALKRPFARISGDYQVPFAHRIPNYVTVRTVAQMLAQRAQCYLLLNEPERALQELMLLNEFRTLLHGRPMILVTAMIDVAIVGLFETVISDGFRLHRWQEPQIASLSVALEKIDNFARLAEAFRVEQSGISHLVTHITRPQVDDILFSAPFQQRNSFWRKVKNLDWLMFALGPRGWNYQNLAAMNYRQQQFVDTLQDSSQGISSEQWELMEDSFRTMLDKKTPYNYLARIAVPNFSRAVETATRNQAIAQQAIIVGALERYRNNHRVYPERLEVLVPAFLESLPKDPINGKPMNYRRTSENSFLLYSLGWDADDDGGRHASYSEKDGDWVWQ